MKTKEITTQDDTKQAIAWLEKEYPRGIDLVYVDYRDCFEDMETVQKILKHTYEENNFDDGSYESVQEVLKNYKDKLNEGNLSDLDTVDELSDEVAEVMREWLYEHDTSEPLKDMLKNTGKKLFYIKTPDYSEEDSRKNLSKFIKKYATTDAQKAEIEYVLNEQFYGSPVSFYFYASVLDVYNAINRDKADKYITIDGAYFSTIDRIQGSNWLGNNGIFKLAVPKKDFIENIYLDKAKGNGYGWDSIAGQTDYDEATIGTSTNKNELKDIIFIKTETSEEQKQEARLASNWQKTGKCTFGDMTIKRHISTPYRNEYPCGNKCDSCGTFWID